MEKKFLVVFHLKEASLGKDAMKAAIQEHGMRLAQQQKSGELIFAGPCLDHTIAILVYKVDSADEAGEIAKGDPLYKAGMVDFEVHPFVTLDDMLQPGALDAFVGTLG